MIRPPRAAHAAFAALVLAAAPAAAQQRYSEMDQVDAYRTCLTAARADPEAGFEAAIAWRDEGGGPPARHCVALALFGLGQYTEAGERLEALAAEMPQPDQQASILGQAGSVWLRAGDLTRAHQVISEAIDRDDRSPELWIDRGEALARAGKYWEAIDDFSAALDRRARHVDALIFRAAAYRLLEVYDLAHDDVTRALAVEPNHPDALVELGSILIAQHDRDGARRAWLSAIEAAPGSVAADAARGALERLDVKVE